MLGGYGKTMDCRKNCVLGSNRSRHLSRRRLLKASLTGVGVGVTGKVLAHTARAAEERTIPEDGVSRWPLDNESGRVVDVWNGKDGDNRGATRGVEGIDGSSFEFDSGEFVYVGAESDLQIGQNITWTCWLKPNKEGRRNLAMSIGAPAGRIGSDGYHTLMQDGKYAVSITTRSQGNFSFLFGDSVEVGEWAFIAGRYDGNEFRLYQDGELVASETRSGDITYTDNRPFVIGTKSWNRKGSWPGRIDDVRVYDEALSEERIQEIYNSTKEDKLQRINDTGEVYHIGRVTEIEGTVEAGGNISVTGEIQAEASEASESIIYSSVGLSDGTVLDVTQMDGLGSGTVTHTLNIPESANGELVWTFHSTTSVEKATEEFETDAQDGFVDDQGRNMSIVVGTVNGSTSTEVGEGLPGFTAAATLVALVSGAAVLLRRRE